MLDELQIHQIPVLFRGGIRQFEIMPESIELGSFGSSTLPGDGHALSRPPLTWI